MKKFIVYFTCQIEVEAESKQDAQDKATETFKEFEKVVTVTNASVADQATGYFVS